MYNFLVDLSKKLDWPLKEFVNNDEKSQMEALFSLKEKFKKNKQSYDADYQSKLNKQISFFGISVFFNKLNEFNSMLSHIYSDKIILVMSYNEQFKNEKHLFPHNRFIDSLSYVLNLWHQLDSNAEFRSVILKCLNNCKLENLYSLKQFISTYYSIYKYSLLNDKEIAEVVTLNFNQNYRSRVHNIFVLLIEKNLVDVRVFYIFALWHVKLKLFLNK